MKGCINKIYLEPNEWVQVQAAPNCVYDVNNLIQDDWWV